MATFPHPCHPPEEILSQWDSVEDSLACSWPEPTWDGAQAFLHLPQVILVETPTRLLSLQDPQSAPCQATASHEPGDKHSAC